MKAGSFLALLFVIILTSSMFSSGEESTAATPNEDILQYNCYDLVSFRPEIMSDGNQAWIEYFDEVVVINELNDTVDARDGIGAHNIGWEKVHDMENMRLCRPNGITQQWIMKIPLSIYNNLVLGLKS